MVTEAIIELDGPQELVISGSVTHDHLESCEITENSVIYYPDEGGNFAINKGIIQENLDLTISLMCGIWTKSYDSKNVKVIILNMDDIDGDGIQNDVDKCPDGLGEDEGWSSTPNTDYDRDGCEDQTEDIDDDGDMLPDFDDDCLSELGWVSNSTSDHDTDGCSDNFQDDDDDNDGIIDSIDQCPKGELNWESKSYSDYDADGCRDLSEDLDDDNDNIEDSVDDCWRGDLNWTSNVQVDYDGDGCFDATEDTDDDSDGVNDVNETGVTLDLCPRSPLNSTDIDENGCDATERDSDSD